jgi:hypothetical protein
LGRPCGPGALRTRSETPTAAAPHSHSSPAAGIEGEDGPVDSAGVTAAAGAAGRAARPGGRPAASPGVAARRRRRPRGPPAGFGCWPDSGTPVLKGEVGAELPAPLGRGGPAGRLARTGGSWPPRWRRRGGGAWPWCRSGRGRRPEAGRSPPSRRRRCAAGAESRVRECAKVSECFTRCRAGPRVEGWVKECRVGSIWQGRAGAGAVDATQRTVT